MNIRITTIKVDLTPSLKDYIEMRFAPFEKLIARFDPAGGAEIWVEVSRTTQHHKHGDVFRVVGNLKLPGKLLRAEETAPDPRAAIDAVKNILKIEIEKYKTKSSPRRGKD